MLGRLAYVQYLISTVSFVHACVGLQPMANTVTEATLELYSRIVKELPPTPSKFHYIFNLRDLSRIYHGMCLTTPDRFETKEQFVRVWRNECLRVFYDRLTTSKDKQLVSVS